MHALVDLRWLKPGYTGGIEIAARSFVNTLIQLDKVNTYTLLLRPEIRFDFDLKNHPNFRVQVCYGPRYYAVRFLAKFIKRKVSKPGFKRILEQDTDAEIAISLSGYSFEDIRGWKNVLVLPDLQHEFMPQFFDDQELSNRKKAFSASILHAGHICALSEFTRQKVLELYRIPEERISTVYLAPDPIFRPASSNEILHDQNVLNKYGLAPGYLFFPAATWPHKNHHLILQAVAVLNRQSIQKYLLVCTGPRKEAHQDIIQQINELHLNDQVSFLGYCPFEDLPSLYRQAGMLVFPSYYEGFGMPVLEAMACGCPVVCSNRTSLPEIAGEAAMMIDPDSVVELVQAIELLSSKSDLRDDIQRKGFERVKQFSWWKYTYQVVAAACKLSAHSVGFQFSENQNDKLQLLGFQGKRILTKNIRVRMRVAQALEDWRMGNKLESLSRLSGAIMAAPIVVFYAVLFPALRDKLLHIKMSNEF
jgi:glycosyltransferase involved in cell wall biosynthesis